jgi:lipoprotein-releasing system ATP-binding protein
MSDEMRDSPSTTTSPLLQAREVSKSFRQGEQVLKILDQVELTVEPGELVALVGPSGSGKSTLLQILGLLDTPDSGTIFFQGADVSRADDRRRTLIRRTGMGFVYQFHYLQGEFTALENLMIPQMINDMPRKQARIRAEELLGDVGLNHRLHHRPAQLSGGEQQRVAIARALANDPALLMADEPTGNLDPASSGDVLDMMIARVRSRRMGAIIATHNMDLAEQLDRVLEVKNARLRSY